MKRPLGGARPTPRSSPKARQNNPQAIRFRSDSNFNGLLGDLVDILVTHAALDRMEVSAGDDYLARFDKHRASFERVANDELARGGGRKTTGPSRCFLGDF